SLRAYLLLLPFYFVTVFISFFPWSIKLPWLVQKLWRRKKTGVTDPGYSGNSIDNYLATGIAIVFIIFTFVSTKLPHYTLPAFPLLALLLARQLAAEKAATRFFRSCAFASASVYLAIAFIVPPVVARFFPAYQLYRESRDYLRPRMEF